MRIRCAYARIHAHTVFRVVLGLVSVGFLKFPQVSGRFPVWLLVAVVFELNCARGASVMHVPPSRGRRGLVLGGFSRLSHVRVCIRWFLAVQVVVNSRRTAPFLEG